MFAHPVIYPFVMSAQDNDVSERRESVRFVLVVSDAVGGGIDHLVVGAFRLQLFDAAEDRFGFHHHACFAAERVVVHLPVPVERVVAQVVHGDFHQPFLLCPLEDRFVQRRYEQFGNDGYDVYSHGFTCS